MGTSPYTIRLDDELRHLLEQEALLEGRPATQLAVRAIQAMLEAKSAKRNAIDAAMDLADQGRFISSEAMNAWIESWDSERELPPPEADVLPDNQ